MTPSKQGEFIHAAFCLPGFTLKPRLYMWYRHTRAPPAWAKGSNMHMENASMVQFKLYPCGMCLPFFFFLPNNTSKLGLISSLLQSRVSNSYAGLGQGGIPHTFLHRLFTPLRINGIPSVFDTRGNHSHHPIFGYSNPQLDLASALRSLSPLPVEARATQY